jgi:pilus assembly protein CpaB
MTADISAEGGIQGRAAVDPVLGQTLYVVPSEAQRPRMASQTLLQDAVILQMGNFTLPGELTPEQQQAAAQQQAVEGQEAPPPPPAPDVATLIVSPQDAVTLNYLLYTGAQLTLALRAAGDDSRFQTEAVTLQFLLDQYRIPVPVKLPFASEPKIPNLLPPTLKNDAVPASVPAQ